MHFRLLHTAKAEGRCQGAKIGGYKPSGLEVNFSISTAETDQRTKSEQEITVYQNLARKSLFHLGTR